MKTWLRRHFGAWWWIVFPDDSTIGPMRHARAMRWTQDTPFKHRIVWSRGIPA